MSRYGLGNRYRHIQQKGDNNQGLWVLLLGVVILICLPGKVNGQVKSGIRDGKAAETDHAVTSPDRIVSGKSTSGANCRDGFADIYPCLDVNLRAVLTVQDLGGAPGIRVNDLWGWHDEEKGRYYILVGREDGTAFVDVTDPDLPVYLGELPKPLNSSTTVWRDIKVLDHFAVIVADGTRSHGMQIFDLHDLRNTDGLPAVYTVSAQYDGFESAHNIVVDEESGFAYGVGTRRSVNGCEVGLHMIDLADPLNPEFAGCHLDLRSRRGYIHDAQCVVYRGPDSEHFGKQVCFESNENAFSIVDVTDKQNPSPLGVGTYPSSGYVHQGWLTDDFTYFYLDDEGDEGRMPGTRTLIWDVKDLDDPILVSEFIAPVRSIDHNQYISGDFAYQANYSSGLRILDISDAENPQLVKYFDTHPSDNDISFNGAWSVFPFFNNGMVYVSSRDEGLFILDPGNSPVTEITALVVNLDASDVHFSWETSAEYEIQGFEIQERQNDGSFKMRVFIEGSGTSRDNHSYSHVLKNESDGRHEYRLQVVSQDDTRKSESSEEVFIVPGTHLLSTIYPNPSNEQSQVELMVSESQNVRAVLYDVQGRDVRIVHDGVIFEATLYRLRINTKSITSGKYFLRIEGKTFSETLSLVIAR